MFDLEEIKITVRSILTAFKHGCPINTLNKEYYETCGEPLPYRKFGFNNASELLQKMPEVARFGFNKQNEQVVFAVSTAETEHVASLVRRQKSAPVKKSASRGHPNRRSKYPVSKLYQQSSSSLLSSSSSSKSNAKSGASYANYYRNRNAPVTMNKVLATSAFCNNKSNFSLKSNFKSFSTITNNNNNNNNNNIQRSRMSPSPLSGFAAASLRQDGFESWKSDRKKQIEPLDITTIGLNPAGFSSEISPNKTLSESIFYRPTTVAPTVINNGHVSTPSDPVINKSNVLVNQNPTLGFGRGRGLPFVTRTAMTNSNLYYHPNSNRNLNSSCTIETNERKFFDTSSMDIRKFLRAPVSTTDTTVVCRPSVFSSTEMSLNESNGDVKVYYDDDWEEETMTINRESLDTALNRNTASLADLKITISNKDPSLSVIEDNVSVIEVDSFESPPNGRHVEICSPPKEGKSSIHQLVPNGNAAKSSPNRQYQPKLLSSYRSRRGRHMQAPAKPVKLEDIPQDMIFTNIIHLSTDKLKPRAENDGDF